MRDGWSLNDAGAILGIHPRRVTQGLDPALVKIARLWKADPTRTMVAILAAVRELSDQERKREEMLQIRRGNLVRPA